MNITAKSTGPGGDYTLSASNSYDTAHFGQPSFTAAPSASALTGGYDAGVIDNQPFRTLYAYDALGNLLRVDQKGSAPNDSTQWRTRTFTYDSLSRLLTANNPESGTITYSYDADGNLLQKTSPAPNQTGTATQTVSYCYDALHRVTGKGYGAQSCPLATPVVSYVYDSGANAKGHLTSLTDQAGTASYSYDILGRLATETRTLTGANNAAISKNISYTYNLDGSIKTLTYPSGNVITYAPDSAGRVLSAIDSGSGINYVTGATYGPDSALTGFISGNSGTFAGITSAFSYNKRLQPVNMSATAPSQTVYSIGYDFHLGNGTTGSDNGNVFGIYNYRDRNRDQTFTYDALNRLISAQNAGTDCTAHVLQNKTKYWGNSYEYDAWGNLLNKSVTKCGAENLVVTADAHNWIHASGTDYQYDAAGNMTYDATAALSYNFDQENRLTGAAGYTYTYDSDGNRVRKSNGNLAANGTLYWEMTPGVVAETDLAGTTKSEYIFFDGERVARRDGATGTGGVFYYFSDHLKTASIITDSAGTIKAESDYYPWGGELQFVNNDSNDYKFTGKKRDLETGLDYFGARYYSNGLGRWVSADWSSTPVPVPYADSGDPQSLNLYGYVRGLPTTKYDADGHFIVQQEAWKQSRAEYLEQKAAEQKADAKTTQDFIDRHPLLKAWDQFTQKVDNALNGHGWKTDEQAAAADATNKAQWAQQNPSIPYPDIKIGIVAPMAALADDALVVRGGLNQAENFVEGTGVTVNEAGKLEGVSVNSANGASVGDLSKGIKNGQVGVSTAGEVRAAGGQVTPTPTAANPNHCTMCGITPQKAQELFTPTIKNPSKP